MTDPVFIPFLINDRSSALLHLIDAFQFTESELSDVYDGVFNRMKEHFAPNNTDKPLTPIKDYVDNIPETSEEIPNLHEMQCVDSAGNPCDLEDLLDELEDIESGYSDSY